jgi:hypothetical protein
VRGRYGYAAHAAVGGFLLPLRPIRGHAGRAPRRTLHAILSVRRSGCCVPSPNASLRPMRWADSCGAAEHGHDSPNGSIWPAKTRAEAQGGCGSSSLTKTRTSFLDEQGEEALLVFFC